MRGWIAFAVVTLFGLVLLWPVPAGRMPLSADHTVHLTRIFLTADQLGHGRFAGWSSTWFFGFPVGELYPPLGDLIIIGVHGLGLGVLDWWQSYALGFTLVFLLQGWAMLRAGRAFGLGLAPGLIAALLALADPGMYREGGWMYTVEYGVWPQALATSLCWWGFAELALAWRGGRERASARGLVQAALVLGGALLAHPMAMPMIALGVPVFVLCMGLRGGGLRRHLATTTVSVLIALGIAAWWLVPMLAHRGWMASYGWLFAGLDEMTKRALDGQWSYRMPAAVGYMAGLGLFWAAAAGRGFSRFVAAFALLSWLLASTDVFWSLRLDRLSEGFSHIQYQRFLLAAKPGFYLAAGGIIGAAVHLVEEIAAHRWRSDSNPRLRGGVAIGCIGFVGASVAWLVVDSSRGMAEHEVGTIQGQRDPERPSFDADYQALLAWAAERRAESDAFYRIAYDAPRNLHWFMDSPVVTRTASYKVGFTPGDNFVHKPESRRPPVLDRLRVRYVVRRKPGDRASGDEVARFGDIRVRERASEMGVATVDAGAIEILEDDPDAGRVRVRVTGAGAGTRLLFNISGYPRWRLRHDGTPLEWEEFPVFGEGPRASLEARRSGALRGGKAQGDDGSEPTLIGVAEATDGEYLLEYEYRQWFDWLAGIVSALALLACTAVVWPARRRLAFMARTEAAVGRVVALATRAAHPAGIAGALVVLVIVFGQRWLTAAEEESGNATGWMLDGRTRHVSGMRVAPFKADMLIRSAVRVHPRRKARATAVFPSVPAPQRLRGWVALDDDAAKQSGRGRHQFFVEGRPAGAQEWTPLLDLKLRHRPNRIPLEIEMGALSGETVDLRVRVDSRGKAPPPLAFDLELTPRGSK